MPDKTGIVFWLAAAWFGVVLFCAASATLWPLPPPDQIDWVNLAAKPGVAGHLLGTDNMGRDIAARLLFGARVSLTVGTFAPCIGLAAGTLLGVLAGYYRGYPEKFIVAAIDTFLAFPRLIFLMMITFVFGSSLLNLTLALGFMTAPTFARVARANTLRFAGREFVLAARGAGAGDVSIILREILPNVLMPMLAYLLLVMGLVIIAEGGLGFLGLSVPSPTPSWGGMIAEGREVLEQSPHVSMIPTTVMFLTIMAVNLIGDRLRGWFDTRREPAMTASPKDILSVENLVVHLPSNRGVVRAVDGVSFTLERGKTLALVGESGSGKSMLCRAILGLMPERAILSPAGRISFAGQELGKMAKKERDRVLGREIGIVLQNPMSSLNPVQRIGWQIAEPMRYHLGLSTTKARERSVELLRAVGISQPEERLACYPHQLSGGMRQRVAIAIALACDPQLLIADEPTTALDVTVQAEILNLLSRLQEERNMAMILVTHDLGVVAGRAHDTAVMYAGRIVEHAPTPLLFDRMRMPYTRALFNAIPKLDDPPHKALKAIDGQPPDLSAPFAGCPFAPRCPKAGERCREAAPPLACDEDESHRYACWFPYRDGNRVSHE